MVVEDATSTAFEEESAEAKALADDDEAAQNPLPETQESLLHDLLRPPHSRLVGGTEYSWFQAVNGGTGITILAFLFSKSPDVSVLQKAIDKLLFIHPRLRSQLVWIHGRPAFSVSTEPKAKLEVCDEKQHMLERGHDKEERASGKDWLRLVEAELNTNVWQQQYHCLDPAPLFVVRLHNSLEGRALLIFRLHTSICDRASGATIFRQMLFFYDELKNGHSSSTEDEGKEKKTLSCHDNTEADCLAAIEDVIPRGKADKPFWSHGLDLLGYSLGSRRHSLLPFQGANKAQNSEIISMSLSAEQTQQLIQMCGRERTNRFGALSAAGLKATAILKKLGNRDEHYALITLIDCRSHLIPVISSSAVGFYHSAILNTHTVNESVNLWDLARRCSSALENSIKNRKHFTDMGDINFLMCQAIQYPQLTPAASLRTSLMVFFEEPIIDDMEELKQAVDLEDYLGCSSVHGVGPCIAFFDTIKHGCLQSTCVYPAPLYSEDLINTLLTTMVSILVDALQN